jgi:DNA-binding NarL/FixJ family response regulator
VSWAIGSSVLGCAEGVVGFARLSVFSGLGLKRVGSMMSQEDGQGRVFVSELQADPEPTHSAHDPLETAIQAHCRGLTSRERQVLKMVIEGKTTKAIAFVLGISPRTVEVHRTGILRKTLKANFLELSRTLHESARTAASY